MITPERAQTMNEEELAGYYRVRTGTFTWPRKVRLVGAHLWVQPAYRWTHDDDEMPNEGLVEYYELDSIGDIPVEIVPIAGTPLEEGWESPDKEENDRRDERRAHFEALSDADLALWYKEVTGTFDDPRAIKLIGDTLWVQPRYRWTGDDERRPNEGEVETYSILNHSGAVLDRFPIEKTPLART